MKVLVVSHTYIARVGREKWRELVRLFDVDLRIIVPTLWKDYLFTIRYRDHREDAIRMRAKRVIFSGREAAHFYLDPMFTLPRFSPDILHVEEGTDSLAFAQVLFAKNLLSRSTKSIFFTWMNWEKKLRFPFAAIERYNLSRADAAIAGNTDAKRILETKGFRRPVTVMPLLGLDSDLFSPRDETALKSSLALRGFVIGFVGRFVPEKGVLDLIEAASRLNGDWTLLFVGGGSLEDRMRTEADSHGIGERVRFVKPVPHQEIPRYLNCMDALVLPSYTAPHWKEQFGQVLVQAMACEVPVIGSSHAEIPRVIGDAGLVFEERNTDALETSLRTLMEDGELCARLKKEGRQRVLDHYTNTRIAERTYGVYRSLLD